MEVVGLACDTGGPLVAPGGAQRIMAPLKDTLAAARKLDYLNVFHAIAAKGYAGFLGLEMWPTLDHTQAIRQSIALWAEATAGRK